MIMQQALESFITEDSTESIKRAILLLESGRVSEALSILKDTLPYLEKRIVPYDPNKHG